MDLNANNKLSKIEEVVNRKRKMSVVKFMDKFKFELFDSLKIWLMTPEVVSDILPFEKNLFDLVIFDEASQLYVEKSLPAIYRAKKVRQNSTFFLKSIYLFAWQALIRVL